MQPVVSPWFVYCLSIIEGIKTAFIFASLVFGAFTVGLAMEWVIDGINISEIKRLKIISILFLFSICGSILIPDKSTLIGMYIAKNITYNRIEKVVKHSKDFHKILKKDMLDIIEEIEKRNNRNK